MNKRVKKYGSIIKRQQGVDIKPHGLYYTDKDKVFRDQEALLVKVNGITYQTMLDLYKDLQDKHRELKEFIKAQNQSLTAFLIANGYNTPNVDLNALIKDLDNLLVINENENYELLTFNDEGYISGSVKLDGKIIDESPKPIDFDKGWYTYVNGEYIVDEDKKNEIIGGMF